MASKVTTVSASIDPQVAAAIEDIGVKFELVPQYDLEKLSPVKRIQFRDLGKDSGNWAHKDDIETYAVQMKAGVAFPPTIVTRDGWTVDGNTRHGALLKLRQHFAPVIVLDIEYDLATPTQQNELFALGAGQNLIGPKRLTPAEVRHAVDIFVRELNWGADQVATKLGQAKGVVTKIKQEIAATEKLERVGLKPDDDLSVAALRGLGTTKALSLNDEPFRSLANLSLDAGLSYPEIVGFAKLVKDSGSDTAAMEVFAGIRTDMAQRIRNVRHGAGPGKPPNSGKLRQYEGMIATAAKDGGAASLVETNPDPAVVSLHLEKIRSTIVLLTEVVSLQEARALELEARGAV